MVAPVPNPEKSDVAKTLTWRHDDTPEAERHNQNVMRQIGAMVRANQREEVLGIFEDWPAEDILDCVAHIRTRDTLQVMEWLPDDIGIAVLSELNPEYRRVLFKDTTKRKFRKLVERMKPKAARKLLLDLPPEIASELVAGRSDADELMVALRHGSESAAAVMQHRSLSIPQSWTLGELIADITAREKEIDKIDGLMVVDQDSRLVGYLRVRDLLLHPPDTKVADVMRRDVISVSASTDREDVLSLARRERRQVLAVVDHEGRLIGAITTAELADIERMEAREDMLRMGGLSPDSSLFDSPWQIMRKRSPWLLVGLIGALFAAFVIAGFEETLAEAAILASFIPVVMATAGNVGIQASTVSIQALTSETQEHDDVFSRLGREVFGSVLNGIIVGGVTATIIFLVAPILGLERPADLAVTAFLSLLIVIVLTGIIGATIPIVLHRMGLDPSVATGIFIVTSADVFGVLVYFLMAQAFYL